MQTFLQEFEEKPVSRRALEQKRSYRNWVPDQLIQQKHFSPLSTIIAFPYNFS
jgi:hypothetical protein